MCWLRNDSGTRDLLLVRRDILSICSQFARARSVVPTAPFGTPLHLRPLLCTTFDATVDELSGLVKEYKEREAQAILDRLAKRGRTKRGRTSAIQPKLDENGHLLRAIVDKAEAYRKFMTAPRSPGVLDAETRTPFALGTGRSRSFL
jgi:hypothetical protein